MNEHILCAFFGMKIDSLTYLTLIMETFSSIQKMYGYFEAGYVVTLNNDDFYCYT